MCQRTGVGKRSWPILAAWLLSTAMDRDDGAIESRLTQPFVFEVEDVDDAGQLRVGFGQLGDLLAGGRQSLDGRVQAIAQPLLAWRGVALGEDAGVELVLEVGVAVGQDVAFAACLDRERDNGECAVGPQRFSLRASGGTRRRKPSGTLMRLYVIGYSNRGNFILLGILGGCRVGANYLSRPPAVRH